MDKQETTRRLHAILEPEGCWHEKKRIGDTNIHLISREDEPVCIKCHVLNPHNPTYSNPAVIAEKMRERGLWEEFVEWHMCESYDWAMSRAECDGMAREIHADILTTPDLLAQAIVSWWETTHKWTDNNHYEVTG